MSGSDKNGGTFIVSLDFELFWGMQDHRKPEEYKENILGGRRAIPRLLALFEKYGIHATWAAVGMVFAENAEEAEKYFAPANRRPSYKNALLSGYRLYEQPGFLTEERDCFFAPELIEKVAAADGQEIGSHTFSHYYCREAGQTTEQFRADMEAAKRIAEAKGFTLTSAVMPRNQCEPEYTKILSELGFNAYRDEENDWIHDRIKINIIKRMLQLANVYFPLTGSGAYSPVKEYGVRNLTGSGMYKPFFRPLSFMESLKIRRIKRQMLYAAKHGLTYHLWFHPHNVGTRTELHLSQLEEIFRYYAELNGRYGMKSLNMREAAARADER